MEYKKIDTFFMNSDISNDMIRQANYDMIGQTKRNMANKLTDMAIHKHTSNILLHFAFSVEEIDTETIDIDYYRAFYRGCTQIKAKLEVFQANE